MTLEEFAKKTDYSLLTNQKLTLLNLLNKNELPETQDEDLMGLINFIDMFQDVVVENDVLPEEEVFPI